MINKMFVDSITLSRFLLSIAFAYYIITDNKNILPVTILFILICITDLADGKLARGLDVSSKTGAYLDVLADLFFMLSAGIALSINNHYPLWMLAIIIGKFLEFWYTSSLVRKSGSKENNVFLSDRLGRKVATAFYMLPYIVIVSGCCFAEKISILVINMICITITAGAGMSSMKRIRICMRYRSSDTLHRMNYRIEKNKMIENAGDKAIGILMK